MISTPLCSACRAMIDSAQPPEIVVQPEHALYPPEHERQPHHETVESLLKAAEEGCAICARMRRRLGRTTGSASRRNLTRSLAIQRKQGREWCTTWVLMQPASFGADDAKATPRLRLVIVANRAYFTDPSWLSLSLPLIPPGDLKHPLMLSRRPEEIGRSTTSDSSWAHAKQWYAKCSTSHTACKPQDSTFLPTRLLEVGHIASNIVKLIICADLPPPPSHASSNNNNKYNDNEHRYATLSHCWGGANVPTLTALTIDSLLQGVATASLPKTFAEAITATRTMGIPFLWIDSLCIVQDSPEDWAAEAGIMGAVYTNSTLNIMATASRNSHGGLSRERDPELLQPIMVKTATAWTTRRGSDSALCITVDDDDSRQWQHLAEEDFWKTSVTEEPLNTRGWVLQERVLTSRALHFGSEQLLWECRCLNACETYPQGVPEDLLDNVDRIKPLDQSQLTIARKQTQDSRVLEGAQQSALPVEQLVKMRQLQQSILAQLRQAYCDARLYELDSIWANWIQAYSAAKLTHRSDKMIALSGLAKQMRSLRRGIPGGDGDGDRYLAGLWRRGILDQLLWHAIHPDETSKHHMTGARSLTRVETGIPTWSWASVDTEVIPGFAVDDSRFHVERHVEVLDATTCPLPNGDETGSLKGGELRLKCSTVLFGTVGPRTVHIDGIGKISRVGLHLDERLRIPAEVVLVPVRTTCERDTEVSCAEVSILVLRHAAEKPKGYYRRIGLMVHERDLEAEQQEARSVWRQQVLETSLFLQDTHGVLVIV